MNDSTMAQGQSAVTTAGQNGERTRTYRVTLTDGKETKRELVSDAVTVPPITEVTSVGTYVEPAAPPPPAAAPGDCDPNYADACVPIADDVDCAGGKGNGPAYFDGVARVVGRDIYKLDGDGDGWACNGWRVASCQAVPSHREGARPARGVSSFEQMSEGVATLEAWKRSRR